MKILMILLGCIYFAGTPLFAQFGNYERILLPIHISVDTAGAYGSQWTTRAVAHNNGERAVPIRQSPESCADIACPFARPRTTFSLDLLATPSNGRGALLWIGIPGNDQLSFNLRVQDLSRQALTWGTEIPIVHEHEAFSSTINLLNIPMDNRFRQALRIYEIYPETGRVKDVMLRVFPSESDVPVVTQAVRLELDQRESPWTRPLELRILDLVGAFPVLQAFEAVRIELEPLTPGMRFWAFVSITNNETQHVTTITPN